ncbi:MAG: hypothetical protein FRX48_04731 [Lasallia pustulata]|uniref:Methyltransferase domain-containing protein n=1 Tax=Lasallia pustulata TaxID=136370 RepID=A0A5M8PS72_9LECA|nr:MAG: hypothetical protein FRX48_04731 [Lasallia pustulata]
MTTTPQIKPIPIEALYTRWAPSYDQSHQNTVQGHDEIELATLFPKFLSHILSAPSAPPLKIIDFGCGTGRNTLKLLNLPSATIVGLDATPQMIDLARRRCQERLASLPPDARAAHVRCEIYNPLVQPTPPECAREAGALISTLVVEHFTLPEFFEATGKLLRSGGFCMVTGVHSDLAQISHPSIVDTDTGELVWGATHVHSVEDVEKEAPKWGFEVLEVQEGSPKDPDLVGANRGHWEGVKCWVGFLLRKK